MFTAFSKLSTKTPNIDEVEQSNKHSIQSTYGRPLQVMESLFLYAEVTNQAIFNEYQHHLTDNSLHFMNEARRGKNEERKKL